MLLNQCFTNYVDIRALFCKIATYPYQYKLVKNAFDLLKYYTTFKGPVTVI